MGAPDTLDLWLEGRFAGQILRGNTGEVELIYDKEYLDEPSSTPLSVSMPKIHTGYGPDIVMPWLSGLLPDAIEVRDRWAAKFGERRNDPFTLLRYMGQDAPGAVQVVAEGVDPSSVGSLAAIKDQQIAERIAQIMIDPDHWVDDKNEDESRFSLGGNQGKFALSRIGDAWFEPNGRAASTHIVKPGMVTATGVTNAGVQAVEFATMRAARFVGIPTATVEIVDFAGLPTFVTTRYDRHIRDDGTVVRIHQEDFCQALGALPARKYEQDGGPTMADMRQLVQQHSSVAYHDRDQAVLAQLFCFNLLIAGVDAHAKNHSLLLSSAQTRLAPAYDLISAHGLWDSDRIQFKASAALKYGKNRRYRTISGRDLVRTADVLNLDRLAFVEQLRDLATKLPEAFETAIAELPEGFGDESVVRIPERIGAFASRLTASVSGADLTDTAKFDGTHSWRGEAGGRVWVPGSRSPDGAWNTGHYRSR